MKTDWKVGDKFCVRTIERLKKEGLSVLADTHVLGIQNETYRQMYGNVQTVKNLDATSVSNGQYWFLHSMITVAK